MISKAVYSIGYRCINKLNKFIKAYKDKKIISDKNNIIYKIQCNNCDVSYVGQTKKKLNTKINEHIKNIKLGSSRHSIITEHRLHIQYYNIIIILTERVLE